MLRVIGKIEIKGGFAVKGRQFEGLKKMSTPIQAFENALSLGINEFMVIDIVSSLYRRPPDLSVITEIKKRYNLPICYEGGIYSNDQALQCFDAGVDKISMNTASCNNPVLIEYLVKMYGSQSITASFNAGLIEGEIRNLCKFGREDLGINLINWVKSMTSLGVGEIIVNSIHHDGMHFGPDYALVQSFRPHVICNLLYSGGIRSFEQLARLERLGVEGVICSSVIHERYSRTSFDLKSYFRNEKNISS